MKKIAIITGASSGIGRQFALTVTSHGSFDEIWAVARNKERLEALKNEISVPVRPISLDLQKPEFIDMMRSLLEEEKPNIGLLINAGGYGKFDAVENVSLEENLGMIDLNCRALAAMTQLCLPYMSKGSLVIEIASVAAFQPIPYIDIYAASKAFVLSYSRALNREVKKKGIRVFAVCPFWTSTGFFDRAIDKDKQAVVKKYVAMYKPEYIVKYTWRSLRHKNKDYCIPGFKARVQALEVKLLPHKLVMSVWMKQQKLD